MQQRQVRSGHAHPGQLPHQDGQAAVTAAAARHTTACLVVQLMQLPQQLSLPHIQGPFNAAPKAAICCAGVEEFLALKQLDQPRQPLRGAHM